jgi:hypothetical protein
MWAIVAFVLGKSTLRGVVTPVAKTVLDPHGPYSPPRKAQIMASSLASVRRRLPALAAGSALVVAALTYAAPANAATTFITPAQLNTSETRATGHNDFVADGVRVWTESNTTTDKAAGYFAVDADLADVGEPSMDAVRNDPTTNVRPGLQLVVDFDGNGSVDGILVGEPTYADGTPLYGDTWWLSNSSKQFVKDGAPAHGGGYGSDNNGTLAQWRVAFPDAHVSAFGWSLGSGVKGDVTIRSMTLGTTTYKFVGTGAPVVLDVSGSGAFNTAVTIPLEAYDPDGGPLKYTVGTSANGYARVQGSNAIFRPKGGFTGVATFTYTARDAQGLVGTGTVTVTIAKAPSTLTLSQQNTYQKNTAIVSGRVVSKGAAKGGTITVMEGATTVAVATLTGNSFRIKVPGPVSTGLHLYDVSFSGSAQTEEASGSVTLNVR